MRKLRVGDLVKVKGHPGKANIETFYQDVEGGVRLSTRIGGFYSWNVRDLILLPHRPSNHRRPNVEPDHA